MKSTYTVWASNNQGASTNVGIDMDHPNGGRKFTSLNDAITTARREMASGWRIHILRDDVEIKTFTIR